MMDTVRRSAGLCGVVAALIVAGCGGSDSKITGPETTDPCEPKSVQFGQTISGSITAESCVVGTSLRVFHALQLSQETDLVLNGTQPTGAGWCLCIYTPDGDYISGAPGGPQYFRLAAGTYHVVVRSHDLDARGDFSFTTSTGTPPAGCNGRPAISRNVRIEGTLGSGDCEWSPKGGGMLDGRLVDQFQTYLHEGATRTVTLTASQPMQIEVRSWLSQDAPITSQIGTSATVQFTVPTGDFYDVMVVGSSGTYTLQVQ